MIQSFCLTQIFPSQIEVPTLPLLSCLSWSLEVLQPNASVVLRLKCVPPCLPCCCFNITFLLVLWEFYACTQWILIIFTPYSSPSSSQVHQLLPIPPNSVFSFSLCVSVIFLSPLNPICIAHILHHRAIYCSRGQNRSTPIKKTSSPSSRSHKLLS